MDLQKFGVEPSPFVRMTGRRAAGAAPCECQAIEVPSLEVIRWSLASGVMRISIPTPTYARFEHVENWNRRGSPKMTLA